MIEVSWRITEKGIAYLSQIKARRRPVTTQAPSRLRKPYVTDLGREYLRTHRKEVMPQGSR